MTILVKRIYDPAEASDGARFLVDRLWPRGVSKDRAELNAWLKALSPSDDLRKRYHGETAESDAAWDEFRRDYFAELELGGEAGEDALGMLLAAAEKGDVTLLYAAKNDERNNAVALQEWLGRS